MADGRAVFVPGAIPGEEARIEIQKDAGRYVVARLVSVENPSSERREPFCPLYGECGGCACQHMAYAETLRQKRRIVGDALERIGGARGFELRETIGMESPYAYRNKAEFAADLSGALGFARAGSHAIVPAADCPLAEGALLPAVYAVRDWLSGPGRGTRLSYAVPRSVGSGRVNLTLSVSSGGLVRPEALLRALPANVSGVSLCRLRPRPANALDGAFSLISGEETLAEELAGLRFTLSPQSFFQINREQCERILKIVADEAASVGGTAADVYCGVGSISLAIAARTEIDSVVGFEIVPRAVENARANAAANGLSNKARFVAGDAALRLPAEVAGGARFGCAVVDPPRKGVDPEALNALLRVKPSKIVYVSCNPATLARDVKLLLGQYDIEYAQPIDMFPWTEHIETVVRLVLRNAATHIHIDGGC